MTVPLTFTCLCGHGHNAAAGVTWRAGAAPPVPRAGDLTVCIHCARVWEFRDNAPPRAVPEAEWPRQTVEDPEAWGHVLRIREVILSGPPP